MRWFVGAGLDKGIVLGVDVGTSSVKVLFIDVDGEILHRAEAKHATKNLELGWAEQEATDYLTGLRKISEENQELIKRVVAVGLSGHTPSVVCVDEAGEAVRPVLTWQDNRSTVEAGLLEEHFANPLETVGTSLPWSASACPAKLFWLSKHEPATVKKTRWVLQPKDYVGFHLTGSAISDPWSTKGICNVLTRGPILQLLDFVGWGPEAMPELKDGYESRGNITPQASAFFKLPVGIPVSVGWSDAMSGMVAMGVMTEPTSFIITGTSAIVGASSCTPPKDGGQLYVIPNTCAPLSVTYGPTQSSGSSIEWAAKALGVDADTFVNLAVTSESEEHPIFLPYIDGERAPIWRPDVRAGFYGISSATKREDLAAAVMEGIGFAERQVVEIAEELNGSRAEEVKLGGHAGNDSRGEIFRLKTLGRPVARFVDTDTTNRGAAILAHAILSKNLNLSTEKLAFAPLRKSPSEEESNYANAKNAEFALVQQQALELADSKIK